MVVTLYANKRVQPPTPPILPNAEWAQREIHAALERSLERLRGIEAKGPGLATIGAILAGGVLLALDSNWDDSTFAGKALLVVAAVYASASLVTPIYLVGQQPRFQLDGLLAEASEHEAAEQWLAEQAGKLWAKNSERITKLGNIQDAARTDLVLAFIALIAWAFLVPVSGALARGTKPAHPGNVRNDHGRSGHAHPHQHVPRCSQPR
jgi:hypothetical protein